MAPAPQGTQAKGAWAVSTQEACPGALPLNPTATGGAGPCPGRQQGLRATPEGWPPGPGLTCSSTSTFDRSLCISSFTSLSTPGEVRAPSQRGPPAPPTRAGLLPPTPTPRPPSLRPSCGAHPGGGRGAPPPKRPRDDAAHSLGPLGGGPRRAWSAPLSLPGCRRRIITHGTSLKCHSAYQK